MARSNVGEGGGGSGPLLPEWALTNPFYVNRKQIGLALLILASLFNLLDLFTTSFAMANGLVETYLPSLMIMSATGSAGYFGAKLGSSLLLFWNAHQVWNKSDKMSATSGLVVLTLSFVMLAMNVMPVVNNVGVLVQLYLG